MKRVLASIIALYILATPAITFAKVTESLETENGEKVETTKTEKVSEADSVPEPKWEDYVPLKYQNPRTDFSRGNSIAELSVGILLTDLLLTAPIGIPMICHATTKIKNLGYAEKKVKFENGLIEARNIDNPDERKRYYNNLITQCQLDTNQKAKNEAKKAKQALKESKKNKK